MLEHMSDRLLLRKPMAMGPEYQAKHDTRWSAEESECGHSRSGRVPFYQECAECEKIPHPRTNPGGYPSRRQRAMA